MKPRPYFFVKRLGLIALISSNGVAGQAPDLEGMSPQSYSGEQAMLLRSVVSGICIVKYSAVRVNGSEIEEEGTGFLLNSSGLMLTAKHVVPTDKIQGDYSLTVDCPYAQYDIRSGRGIGPLTATKVSYSSIADLRLIRVDNLPDDVHPLSLERNDPSLGSKMTIVGYYPKDGRQSPMMRQMDLEQRDDNGLFFTSGAVLRGMSGAPLLNRFGMVVGLYYQRRDLDQAGAPLIGQAVGIETIRRFLGESLSPYSAPLFIRNGKLTETVVAKKESEIAQCERSPEAQLGGKRCVPIGAGYDIGHVCRDMYHDYAFPC